MLPSGQLAAAVEPELGRPPKLPEEAPHVDEEDDLVLPDAWLEIPPPPPGQALESPRPPPPKDAGMFAALVVF